MGERPTPGHTLERINNDGNYEPGNVRWATRQEQQRNMRSNVYLEHGGIRQTASEWSRMLNHKRQNIITKRLDRGWPVKEALFGRGAK